MLEVHYHHPMHGKQIITCHQIIKMNDSLHVKNIHGATFLIIDGDRINQIIVSE